MTDAHNEQGRENDRRCKNAVEAMESIYMDGACRDSTVDLLTDLMHWCKGEGISFEDALRMARDHFTSEAGFDAPSGLGSRIDVIA